MIDRLVSFETAKLAKEKGYNIRSEPYRYNGEQLSILEGLNAPTQSLLQRWLRDIHSIKVIADTDITLSWIWTIQSLHPEASYTGDFILSTHVYNTYEEALERGLQEALKLI